MTIDWEKNFKTLKTNDEIWMVQHLNDIGFIFDEDTFVTRIMIQQAFDKLKDWLFLKGYRGGDLAVTGDFFPLHGDCYIIYDTAKIEYKEALAKLRHSINVINNCLNLIKIYSELYETENRF